MSVCKSTFLKSLYMDNATAEESKPAYPSAPSKLHSAMNSYTASSRVSIALASMTVAILEEFREMMMVQITRKDYKYRTKDR